MFPPKFRALIERLDDMALDYHQLLLDWAATGNIDPAPVCGIALPPMANCAVKS